MDCVVFYFEVSSALCDSCTQSYGNISKFHASFHCIVFPSSFAQNQQTIEVHMSSEVLCLQTSPEHVSTIAEEFMLDIR